MRVIVVLAMLLALRGAAQAAEWIEIPGDDRPLQAALFRPAGNGPFPAVIALHDCDGLRNASGAIQASLDGWGRHLSSAGFLVVFPDSYASRGLAAQCGVRHPVLRPERERVADIRAARDWLQQQRFAQPDRIALVGWASGGIAVLWAVRPNLEPADERPDFRSAAALYPGCRRLGDTAWSARIPTLILVGALDDWTPARDCEQMMAGARKRTARAVLVKYKGAHHAFDRDGLPTQQRGDLAFTPNDSGRATVGTNADARADAQRRIPTWLSR